MAQLPRPVLLPGNLRDLVSELHSLHARAGWPSTREMAQGQPFSHATVHDLFTKTTAPPRLPILLAIVDRLASAVRGADVEAIIDKFDRLWSAAVADPFTPPTLPDDPQAPSTRAEKLQRGRSLRSRLTSRQSEILILMMAGHTADEIARRLYISRTTLQMHQRVLLDKFGVHTRAEVVALAKELEMFEPKFEYLEGPRGT